MADTTARPRHRAAVWWIPAMLAGLIIGVLLAGAGLAVTGHIDQDRYGWRWPAGIGAGALLAAILLVLAATLHEPRRAPRPVPTSADPAASRPPASAEGPTGRRDRAEAGADRSRPGSHRAHPGTPGSHAAGADTTPDSARPDAIRSAGSDGWAGSATQGSAGTDPVGRDAAGHGGAGAGTAAGAPAGDAGPRGSSGPDVGADGDGRGAGLVGDAGPFRQLAAVEPAELDAAWLGRPPGSTGAGRPGVARDGASFFGGTVPADAITSSVAGDTDRGVGAEPGGTDVPAVPRHPAATAESGVTDEPAATDEPAETGGSAQDAAPAGIGSVDSMASLDAAPERAARHIARSAGRGGGEARPGDSRGSGVDRHLTPLAASGAAPGGRAARPARPAESARRDAVPGPRDGAARPVSAIPVPAWAAADAEHPEPVPASPAATDAEHRGPVAAGYAAEAECSEAVPGRLVTSVEHRGPVAARYAADAEHPETVPAGSVIDGEHRESVAARDAANAERSDAVPGRSVTEGEPESAAASAGAGRRPSSSARGEPAAAEGGRYEAPAGADEATVPGLLPDEAERIAAVRAKLAGVLPPGTVGWQVPGGTPGPEQRRAVPGPAQSSTGSARRPVGGTARSSHTARDAAVLRLADARQAPADWDPHIDTDPERTTDLRRGSGTRVRGYVRAGATPVPQAAVTVIDLAGRQADRDVSGTDGWYELAVPRSGTYTLIARARGHQPLASVVAVDGAPVQLDLTLVGTAAIAGRVRLSGGATAVPAAVVSLMDSSGAVLGAVTAGADGTFRFAELIGGGYTVVGNAPGYRPVAVPVAVPSTGTAAVEVALVGDAVLAGIARGGRDHLPLADALVTLLDADGEVAGRCRTGPDGGYRFTGMPPGEYTLVASGYPTVSNALHLTAGSRHDHDILLGYRPDDATPGG
ncbi:carboxypeptidase-like regulatory domain-containing protein [Actinocatenispora sera]|nr:carboxypeptidase-like regulatory domain-containing protein [Actinocatenispora sera]